MAEPTAAAGPAGSACPPLPDPMGEWRTEPWLCNMRRSPIGDNTYLLATKGQRGAKANARGRSVELVHQVLRNFVCEFPGLTTLSVPAGEEYTSASADLVRAFQDLFAVPIDGVVGPETLGAMDFYIHGAPIPQPPDCTGFHLSCPPRAATEEAESAAEPLELVELQRASDDTMLVHLIGFTVDEEDSLDKLSSADRLRLEEIVDPDFARPITTDNEIQCWVQDEITAFGIRDCHELPGLAMARAQTIADEFPDSDIRTDTAPPGSNETIAGRRKNRAVTIALRFRLDREVDLAGGGLEQLFTQYKRQRRALAARYAQTWIRLADQLARGLTDFDDEFLDARGAEELSGQSYPVGCYDSFDWAWKSATDFVSDQLTASADVEAICGRGEDPSLDEFMRAVGALYAAMQAALTVLFREGARLAIASDSAGCPCLGLKEIWDRTGDRSSIYYGLRDRSDFGDWDRKQSCDR